MKTNFYIRMYAIFRLDLLQDVDIYYVKTM